MYKIDGVYKETITDHLISESMYKFDVFLINFGYVCGCYKSIDEAIEAGHKTGYEFAVYENFPNRMVWSK